MRIPYMKSGRQHGRSASDMRQIFAEIDDEEIDSIESLPRDIEHDEDDVDAAPRKPDASEDHARVRTAAPATRPRT